MRRGSSFFVDLIHFGQYVQGIFTAQVTIVLGLRFEDNLTSYHTHAWTVRTCGELHLATGVRTKTTMCSQSTDHNKALVTAVALVALHANVTREM